MGHPGRFNFGSANIRVWFGSNQVKSFSSRVCSGHVRGLPKKERRKVEDAIQQAMQWLNWNDFA